MKYRKWAIWACILVFLAIAFYPMKERCVYCHKTVGTRSLVWITWVGRERAHERCFFSNNPMPPPFVGDKPRILPPGEEDWGHLLTNFGTSEAAQERAETRVIWERKRDLMTGQGIQFNRDGITLWDQLLNIFNCSATYKPREYKHHKVCVENEPIN